MDYTRHSVALSPADLARDLLSLDVALFETAVLERGLSLTQMARDTEIVRCQMRAIQAELGRRTRALDLSPSRDMLTLATSGYLSFDIRAMRRSLGPRLVGLEGRGAKEMVSNALRRALDDVEDPTSLAAYIRADVALGLLVERAEVGSRLVQVEADGARALLRRSSWPERGEPVPLDISPLVLANLLDAHARASHAWSVAGFGDGLLLRYRSLPMISPVGKRTL